MLQASQWREGLSGTHILMLGEDAVSSKAGASSEKTSRKSPAKLHRLQGCTAIEQNFPPRPLPVTSWFIEALHHHQEFELEDKGRESAVFLNVYDVSHLKIVQSLNRAALPLGSGVFHVAVEVWQREYSYGGRSSGTGIMQMRPNTDPVHSFRGAISLGRTKLPRRKVNSIISQMASKWQGTDYHILSKNCAHFARALAAELGADPLPDWVDHLSRTASQVFSPITEALNEAFSTLGTLLSPAQCTESPREGMDFVVSLG